MNKGNLVQGYAHQLLEEFNSSAWISICQVLALVSTVFLSLWRGKPYIRADTASYSPCLKPSLALVMSVHSAWEDPGPCGLTWTPAKNPERGKLYYRVWLIHGFIDAVIIS